MIEIFDIVACSFHLLKIAAKMRAREFPRVLDLFIVVFAICFSSIEIAHDRVESRHRQRVNYYEA